MGMRIVASSAMKITEWTDVGCRTFTEDDAESSGWCSAIRMSLYDLKALSRDDLRTFVVENLRTMGEDEALAVWDPAGQTIRSLLQFPP